MLLFLLCSREELLHHLGKDHEWEIKEVTGTFDTEDEFEIFFQRVQKVSGFFHIYFTY